MGWPCVQQGSNAYNKAAVGQAAGGSSLQMRQCGAYTDGVQWAHATLAQQQVRQKKALFCRT